MKKRIAAPIDNKHLMEDALEEVFEDGFYAAQDHGKNHVRHLVGCKSVKEDNVVCESGIVDVQWMFADNAVRITLLAIDEYNCDLQWEETRKIIFNDYCKVFKEWEDPDRDIKVEFYELKNTLTVLFYYENEDDNENENDNPVLREAIKYVRENMDEDDLLIIQATVSKNLKNRQPAWYGVDYGRVERLLYEYGEEHNLIDEDADQEWWEKYGDIDDILVKI